MTSNPKAVVFILGWVGSNELNLRVFENIYERFGVQTVISAVKVRNVLHPNVNSWYKNQAKKLISQLFERKLQHLPLFFHSFSNGGAYLYYHIIIKLLEKQDYKPQISGAIFDSAPVKFCFETMRGFTSAVFTSNPVFNLCISCILYVGITVHRVFQSDLDFANSAGLLVALPARCPELYLYSTSDIVAPYRTLTAFIERRKHAGVHVLTKCWDDTEHVKHVIGHYTEYTESLERFLCDNLKISDLLSILESTRL